MNTFYLRKFLDRVDSFHINCDGKITYDYKNALLLARASGLTSKKRRKVIKRFKKTIMRLLNEMLERQESDV